MAFFLSPISETVGPGKAMRMPMLMAALGEQNRLICNDINVEWHSVDFGANFVACEEMSRLLNA